MDTTETRQPTFHTNENQTTIVTATSSSLSILQGRILENGYFSEKTLSF